MSLPLIAGLVGVLLVLAFRSYGGFIARQHALDDARPTPATQLEDGADYLPTKPFYLLGQHFSAIAAAGPIAGPILAAQLFGWVPCLLWIGIGVVFIGAVHDFSALVASVRHGGRSIAEIVRLHLGHRAWVAMMCFIWVALLYVILAFTDITASTFVGRNDDLGGLTFAFSQGGAVAFASVLYLLLSVAMGLVNRWLKPPLWLTTVVFVPATLGVVWLGTQLSKVMILDARSWGILILAYSFLASMTPVWALLQPRGYLGGFVLYMALAVGVLGILTGGFEIELEAFKTWHAPGATGALFPYLFVTIACGACSGFHGLVCSGTTSKQIARESDTRIVGYGGMLLEGFVAVIALSTVMIATGSQLAGMAPGAIYGAGLGRYAAALIGEEHLTLTTTFGAMAFSTFVFDTLDVSTRLGRYILQELFGWKGRAGMVLATLLTVACPLALLLLAGEGSYRLFWTLFGASNQLLAGLSLLGIWMWMRREGRRAPFIYLPMAFVMAMTVWALVLQIGQAVDAVGRTGPSLSSAAVNGVVSFLLLGFAMVLIGEAVRSARRSTGAAIAGTRGT